MENSHLNDIQLFEYASDELSHAERVTAEHRLAGCEECRSLLALSQVGQQALRRAPHFELPAGALGRTLSALGSQDALAPSQPAGFPLRRWLTVLAPAAAIAGVVVVVIFAARGGDGDSVASESAQPTPAAAEAPADFAPNDESTPAAADPSAVAADSARAPTAAAAESSGSADLEAAQDQALSAEPDLGEAAAPPAAAPEPAPATEEEASPSPATPEAAPAEPTPASSPAVADDAALLTLVDGTADEVLALLATVGVAAVINVDGDIEVAESDADATVDALAGLAPGELAVRVAPAP